MRQTALIVLVVSLAGCGSTQTTVGSSVTTSTSLGETTTASVTTTSVATSLPAEPTSTTGLSIPVGLDGFELGTVELDGTELQVAIADESNERRQGLMGVDDLLSLDGMIFVFSQDVSTGFWMKNTLIPLDIAFFTVDGEYVDGFTMDPCLEDSCPVYKPSGVYRYALEMAAGDMPSDVSRLDW